MHPCAKTPGLRRKRATKASGRIRGWAIALWLVSVFAAPLSAEPVHRFNLPALPLPQALTRLGEQAGISVLIEGSAPGLIAPGLHGERTLGAALDHLLEKSGAEYGFTSNGVLNVRLPAAPAAVAAEQSLGTIVLSATGQPQQLTDAPATMTVIGASGLAGRRSLADALSGLPGLFVSEPGREGLPSVTLRGMGQSYVLFLIDGRPLSASEEATYNGHGSNSKIGFLPPAGALERIEIIRGPMSSLYGSAASGGVINVITRDIPEVWGGEVALDYGPGRGKGGGHSSGMRFYLGGPVLTNRLALSLYGADTRRAEDDLARSGYQQGGGSGSTDRQVYGARLAWTPGERQSLLLDLQRSRLDYRRTALSATTPAATTVTDTQAALTHRIRWNETTATHSFLQWQRTDFRSGTASGQDALTFSSRSTVNARGHTYTIGYEYRNERTRHDPDRLSGTTDPVLRRWHHSLFFEGALTLSPDITLTVGLRADQNENYGFALTPRMYLVWHLRPDLTLKGGIGSGYRMPPLKQADDKVAEPSGGDGRSRDLGNSALRPERSTNYEIGLIWSPGSGAQFGATLFHSRFTDRITRVDLCRTATGQAPACWYQGAQYVALTQYMNEDSARMSGLELTFDMPLELASGSFDLSGNYTWSVSEVTSGRNAGQAFHNVPRHMFNLTARWQGDRGPAIWGQMRARSDVAARGRSPGVPSHVILNLGLNWDLGHDVMGSISLNNATNRRLNDSLQEGRQLWLGLSARF